VLTRGSKTLASRQTIFVSGGVLYEDFNCDTVFVDTEVLAITVQGYIPAMTPCFNRSFRIKLHQLSHSVAQNACCEQNHAAYCLKHCLTRISRRNYRNVLKKLS